MDRQAALEDDRSHLFRGRPRRFGVEVLASECLTSSAS